MENLQQDMNDVAQAPTLMMVKLLFRKEQALCEVKEWENALKKVFGKVYVEGKDDLYMVSISSMKATFLEQDETIEVPVLWNMLTCQPFSIDRIDEIKRSQFWDVENAYEILSYCSHEIALFDMMATNLEDQKRIELLVHGVEETLRLYEDCVGIYVEATGKFLLREQVLAFSQEDILDRFVHMFVNVRLFHVEGRDEHIVDSLGLFVLKGADVQVHYHGIDGNAIASYVYQIVAYQLQNNFVIASNETIDGIDENGNIQRMIQWTCRYEQSLVQPIREVLDICPGRYAAGNRDHS